MSTTTVPDSCRDLLAEMVHFDTVNTRISGVPKAETKLGEYLDAVCSAAGFKTQRFDVPDEAFNLIVSYEVDPAAPWLVFESHMDTVGVEGMTVDPFAAKIEGGKMFGRGACDTKGTGAAMFWALRQYAEGGDQPNNIAIAFAVDEEQTKRGANALGQKHFAEAGIKPVGVIVGEPTMCRPIAAHNGCVRWTIRTHGVAAHSSNPSLGKSAINGMCKVILAVEGTYAPSLTAEHELTGKAQCSINIIRGGSAVNVLCDRCDVEVDRRVVPGEDATEVLPAVQKVLDDLVRDNPEVEVEQLEPFIDPPLDPAAAGGFLEYVNGVLGGLGIDTTEQGVRYGTDASNFAGVGIPAIVLGPGDIAQAHTKDEWLELDQLDKGIDAYLALMRAEAKA